MADFSIEALDLALGEFYLYPSRESAEHLASTAQDFSDRKLIDEDQTQEILENVAQYLETL